MAHPLYGEVRRKFAAPTRLRRLRGLVATELAAGDNRDEVRVLVRRASLSLDSDLEPDADLLAAERPRARSVWQILPWQIGWRRRRGAPAPGPRHSSPAHMRCRGSARDRRPKRCSRHSRSAELTEQERARFTYLRASNMLWALTDPARAQAIIDDASRVITEGPARSCIDAVRTVYWFAIDRPDAATVTSQHLVLDELPAIVGAETAWALTAIHADAGRTSEAVAIAEAGYTVATRCSDAPHMRFNIADAHVGALLLSGRVADALEVAERERRQAADLPGAAQFLGAAIAGRAALGAGASTPHVRCWNRRSGRCPPRAMRSAGGSATASRTRWRSPCVATAEAAAVLAALDELPRPFRSLDYERSLARAWVAAGQGAVREAIAILRRPPRSPRPMADSRPRSCACRPPAVRRSLVRTAVAGARGDRGGASGRPGRPLRRRRARR